MINNGNAPEARKVTTPGGNVGTPAQNQNEPADSSQMMADQNLLRDQAQAKSAEQIRMNIEESRKIIAYQIEKNQPSRKFTMPYHITCAEFQTFEDDYQQLAVGLVDGAIIIIDLILGIEKHFLEKHPTAISCIAFYENKALISGSICGRVNVSDLENLDKQKVNKTV